MGKNELQLSQHNCIWATPSKAGNNKSLAQSNEGSADENIGRAHSSSLKTQSERKTENKNYFPWLPNPWKNQADPQNWKLQLSKVHHCCQVLSFLLVCCWMTTALHLYYWSGCSITRVMEKSLIKSNPNLKLISTIFKLSHNSFCFLVFSFQQQTECILCFKWFLKLSRPYRAEAGFCLSIVSCWKSSRKLTYYPRGNATVRGWRFMLTWRWLLFLSPPQGGAKKPLYCKLWKKNREMGISCFFRN